MLPVTSQPPQLPGAWPAAQKDGMVSASYATGSVWGGGRAGGTHWKAIVDSTVVASYATGKVSGLKTVGGTHWDWQ